MTQVGSTAKCMWHDDLLLFLYSEEKSRLAARKYARIIQKLGFPVRNVLDQVELAVTILAACGCVCVCVCVCACVHACVHVHTCAHMYPCTCDYACVLVQCIYTIMHTLRLLNAPGH